MGLDQIPDKALHDVERLAEELLLALRRAKLQDEPVTPLLRELVSRTADERRARFDAADKLHNRR